jgi:hypothetical protein
MRERQRQHKDKRQRRQKKRRRLHHRHNHKHPLLSDDDQLEEPHGGPRQQQHRRLTLVLDLVDKQNLQEVFLVSLPEDRLRRPLRPLRPRFGLNMLAVLRTKRTWQI